MFRPQAQAETHSRPGGAPRTSSPTHAETHSRAPGPPRTSSPKREVCCNFATAYFFLFLNRLQAQARAVAQQQRTWMATRFFIDSPQNIGY